MSLDSTSYTKSQKGGNIIRFRDI
uniref:Uncharacterized protein n=1 Tax=Arundo donax TaxID=35708 RepID=A0A0A9C1V3_ARUDO